MENKCSCCNKYKLNYSYEVCPLCGWQDDIVQNEDRDFFCGANELSLNEYSRFYNKGIKFLNGYIQKLIDNINDNISFVDVDLILSAQYNIKVNFNGRIFKLSKVDKNYIITNNKGDILFKTFDLMEFLNYQAHNDLTVIELLKKAEKLMVVKNKIE